MPALLIACSKDDKKEPKKEVLPALWTLFAKPSATITVTDMQGTPIDQAQVLIGDGENLPFKNNLLLSAHGQVAAPAAWTTPQSVTVSAPGYVRVTYLQQAPGSLTIQMHRASSATKHTVQGRATGLPVEDFDNYADFGLVMPALSKNDILDFDMNTIISAQSDHFSTLTQDMAVPSNISLPTQQESYSWFTATLDKPQYHISVDQEGPTPLYVIKGRFDFEPVADALTSGSSFFDVINSFTITGGALHQVNIHGPVTEADLSTDELSFTDSRATKAPAIKADETYLAVATVAKDGYLIPTDIKNIAKNKTATLALLPNTDSQLLAVVKKTADLGAGLHAKVSANPMSAALLPFTDGTAPQLLPLIDAPKLSASGDLTLPKVSGLPGVEPIATYSVLSQIQESRDQDDKLIQTSTRLWEVYAPQWVSQIKMPVWPNDTVVNGKKRWQVSFVGGQNASQEAMGPAIIDNATHVTNSSLDF